MVLVVDGRGAVPNDSSLASDPRGEFAAWVEPHVASMTRMAARLVPLSDLEDVVQNSLVRAWLRRSTFDPDRGSPAGWLLAIVRDQARRHRTRQPAATSTLHDGIPAAESHQRDYSLEQAIAQLAPRQRLAINLHYFVGLDLKGCAEVMECAEGTAKATLHQARQRLQTILAEEANADA